LEKLIVKEESNNKILRVVDLTRSIAKDNIQSELSLRARLDKDTP